MSTNFYRKPIISAEMKSAMHSMVDSNEFDSLKNVIDEIQKGVHICKRSGGWVISFDHNWGTYYDITRESITKFLSEPGYEVVDEYGRTMTVDEFWNMVDEWNAGTTPDGANLWDSKSYREWEKENYPGFHPHYESHLERERVKRTFGIETKEEDFYNDGLRFSVCSEFS